MKVKDIAKIQGGYAFKSDEFISNGIPVIRIGNITDGEANLDSDICSNVEFWFEHPEFRVYNGDILIAMSGATVGKVGRYSHDEKALLNQRVCKVVPKENVEPKYIYYYCLSKLFKKQIVNNAFGCAQPNISGKQIEDFVIMVPDIGEQKIAIDKFEKISNLIMLKKMQLVQLDLLIKSRFVEMFGDPNTNSMGWEQVAIKDICSSIVRGPFGSALKKEFFVEAAPNTYKVYEQKNAIQKSATIGTYYVTKEKYQELKRFECSSGDILMSCSGTMGELYQLPNGCETGIINQALCKFTLNGKMLPTVFLFYMEQTIGNLETKGSGIQNIASVSYIKSMPVILPPMETQEKFVNFFTQVDKSKFAVWK